MDIEEVKRKVRNDQYVYSHHAEIERKVGDWGLGQVVPSREKTCTPCLEAGALF